MTRRRLGNAVAPKVIPPSQILAAIRSASGRRRLLEDHSYDWVSMLQTSAFIAGGCCRRAQPRRARQFRPPARAHAACRAWPGGSKRRGRAAGRVPVPAGEHLSFSNTKIVLDAEVQNQFVIIARETIVFGERWRRPQHAIKQARRRMCARARSAGASASLQASRSVAPRVLQPAPGPNVTITWSPASLAIDCHYELCLPSVFGGRDPGSQYCALCVPVSCR